MKKFAFILASLAVFTSIASAQTPDQDWCRFLPHAGYKTLHRVNVSGASVSDSWFEVYEVSPATYAIYEPRQSEETIGYLIIGNKRSVLFDTGMGIGDLKKLVSQLTKLPVIVLNSHTHGDHVGGNWQFDTIYGMDTDFTRTSAKGSSAQAKEEIQAKEICGSLPAGFDPKTYVTRPWKITKYIHDGEQIDLGGRTLQVIATPGHTPDAICLFDKVNGLLFTGDTYYPGTIYLFAPETDLEAYSKSVHRLAELAPEVKTVLGAHNFPIEPPSVLTGLWASFEEVRAGKIAAVTAGPGKVQYKASTISFLMKAMK